MEFVQKVVVEIMERENWNLYRTRFLVRARQLTQPLVFTDSLGREHSGQSGDYLVETSEGIRRITSCALFEDIYVPISRDTGACLPTDVQNTSAVPGVTRPATRVEAETRSRAVA
jgi:hypothetical protein